MVDYKYTYTDKYTIKSILDYFKSLSQNGYKIEPEFLNTDLDKIISIKINPAGLSFPTDISVGMEYVVSSNEHFYIYETVNVYNFVNSVSLNEVERQYILDFTKDLLNALDNAKGSFDENVEPETKETTKDDLLEIIDEPETTELEQDTQDEVVYTEPKKKRGRPVKGVVQAVVETIKGVLDFTKQKSKITVAEKNDERIILSYDRHKEKYEVIKDRYEPIGYVEPFKEVIKRGLVPEMSKDAMVYGQSYKMETPVQRCLRVKKQLANAEQQLKDVNSSINELNEQNIKLQEQLNTQVNNTDKGEQK